MLWSPTLKPVVVYEATPPESVPGPKVAGPSLKVTVPVGVPPDDDTVAVNVTDCPTVLGLAEDETLVVLPALLTVCVTPADVEVEKLLLPP